MKKLTALILSVTIMFTLTACGALPFGKGKIVEGIWNFDNGISMTFNKDSSGFIYSPHESAMRWRYNRQLDCFDCVKTDSGERFTVTYTGENDNIVLHYNGSNGYRGDSVTPNTVPPMTTGAMLTEMPTTAAPATTYVPTTMGTSAPPQTTVWTTANTIQYDDSTEQGGDGDGDGTSFDINELDMLKLKTAYTAKNGLKVTLNSYTVTETEGYVSHKISYTIKNEVRDSEILPGSFKVYFNDGTAEPQYGFFNYMYYGDEIEREYEWKVLKTKEVLVLEYNPDDSEDESVDSFFTTVPNPDSLHWAVPGNNSSSSGNSINIFGNSGKDKSDIKAALEECEREVSMINITAEILETRLKAYKISKDATLLLEMQEDVDEIDRRLDKILEIISPYKKELYTFYLTCEIDYPIFNSSTTAELSSFITHASRVKTSYDIVCKAWGV